MKPEGDVDIGNSPCEDDEILYDRNRDGKVDRCRSTVPDDAYECEANTDYIDDRNKPLKVFCRPEPEPEPEPEPKAQQTAGTTTTTTTATMATVVMVAATAVVVTAVAATVVLMAAKVMAVAMMQETAGRTQVCDDGAR